MTRKYKPLAQEEGDPSGPIVLHGSYQVELLAGGSSQTVLHNPQRSPHNYHRKEFTEQFDLLQRFFGKLSALNRAVNRIRFLKRQLADVQKRLEDGEKLTCH
ncbi:hypothetical protein NKH81_32900 [Mesorhizobium sp. M0959]|uniref:hypothetical protein n=1 Tax=Mesorhizobium sp. M0959 TaxID=2957034 RepID=UPI00333A7136